MTQLTDTSPDTSAEQRLADLLAELVTAADGPADRALLLDRITEHIVAAIGNDIDVGEAERGSLLHVLDAVDEHCQRMGAFVVTGPGSLTRHNPLFKGPVEGT